MPASDDLSGFAARKHDGSPDRLGQRFSKTAFLPEAGNTIVCHLDFDAPTHARILTGRERMLSLPGASRFLMTPVSSLHMTVFEGVIETRRTRDAWPKEIDRNAPVHDVTTAYLQRLEGFGAPGEFKMRVSGLYPMGLVLEGATPADKAALLEWRNALAEALGFRHAEHDSYVHHMTLGYAAQWLGDDQIEAWQTALPDILTDLQSLDYTVPLKPPAFCTFADMTHFEEQLVLDSA